MKIGIFGGSFDPVHNGHLRLARAAKKTLGLTHVYFVLAPRSPFKKTLTPALARARLALLRLALRGQKGASIGLWELKGRGPAYTHKTVAHVRQLHPSAEIYLILGSDAWAGFPRWKKPEAILKAAHVVVGRRPGARAVHRGRVPKDRFHLLPGIFPDFSSTAIRRALKSQAKSLRALPKSVFLFIRKKKLYGAAA